MHSTGFKAIVQLETVVDIPCYLVNYRGVNTYQSMKSNTKITTQVIRKFSLDLGTSFANTITSNFPDVVPICFSSHSEHEVLLYSAAIPKACRITGMAKMKDPSQPYSKTNRVIIMEGVSSPPKELWKPAPLPRNGDLRLPHEEATIARLDGLAKLDEKYPPWRNAWN